jgi:hypothetical protein
VAAAVTTNVGTKVSVHTKIEIPRLLLLATSGKRCKYHIDALLPHQRITPINEMFHGLAVRSLAPIPKNGDSAGTIATMMLLRGGLLLVCIK